MTITPLKKYFIVIGISFLIVSLILTSVLIQQQTQLAPKAQTSGCYVNLSSPDDGKVYKIGDSFTIYSMFGGTSGRPIRLTYRVTKPAVSANMPIQIQSANPSTVYPNSLSVKAVTAGIANVCVTGEWADGCIYSNCNLPDASYTYIVQDPAVSQTCKGNGYLLDGKCWYYGRYGAGIDCDYVCNRAKTTFDSTYICDRDSSWDDTSTCSVANYFLAQDNRSCSTCTSVNLAGNPSIQEYAASCYRRGASGITMQSVCTNKDSGKKICACKTGVIPTLIPTPTLVPTITSIPTPTATMTPTPTPTTIPCAQVPAGISSWWRAENNFADQLNVYSGDAASNATFIAGKVNSAFNFNGSQVVLAGNNRAFYPVTTPGTFTIEFWAKPGSGIDNICPKNNGGICGTSGQRFAVRPGEFGGSPTIVGVSLGTNGIWVFEHAGGYLTAVSVWRGTISSTVWSHIAVVYSNNSPKLYLNGNLVDTGLIGTSGQAVYPGLGFGQHIYGNYIGALDEISYYNTALSAVDITNIFQKGASGKCVTASTNQIPLPATTSCSTCGFFDSSTSACAKACSVGLSCKGIKKTCGSNVNCWTGTCIKQLTVDPRTDL